MGEVYMGKLILTARGLNSETGQKIIRKCLTEEEEREKKTILLISIQEYSKYGTGIFGRTYFSCIRAD